ncbi:MAG TPA: serine/threonine protein kinase [Oscillatoriaceae cyanobacterium M33_DOE_052]|uniref:Serine/threonine protein kinase n=1 Tax=Planktothricoides sp. SpSt-374 TaxID=2282167 RepID=A0A7C3VJ55_9CYAN|nr:serine/threonine protein kinase [Oscillatoriaceae cyanobacterium M33_DOE_052]
MTYCLNPNCQNPHNSDLAETCKSCGSELLLKNRYRPLHPLGGGAPGGSFLAVDEDKPSKPLCVINSSPTASNTTGSHFGSFSAFASGLDELGEHPQIPNLLASFEEADRYYLVQEYIEGKNLAQELAANGTFTEVKIRKLLQDLLPVLQFLSGSDAIHRDIKPSNIIRPVDGGSLALVDFISAELHTSRTRVKPGIVKGSAEYAAPEQTQGSAVFASDIYSLGVTCLHLLTGLSPFELFDVQSDSWVWSDYLQKPVSDRLTTILNKMVERDPKRRYTIAADILKDLKKPALPAYTKAQKNTAATIFGGAAVAVLSLMVGHRVPTPVPHSTYTTTPIPVTQLEEIPYTLPKLQDSTPRYNKQVPPMRTLASTSGPVWSVAVSPDGKTIASGNTDGTIQVWRVNSGDFQIPIRTLYGHSEPIWSLTVSPDGKLLASGSADKTIKIWDLASGQLLDTLKGHNAGIFSVAFSPDSQRVASGSFDKTVKLWQINTDKDWRFAGNLLHTFIGHTQEVQSVAFNSDGKTLASGSTDGTIKLWNWRTGKLTRTLVGHDDSVWSVAFSPDGRSLASGSWDKTIKLWDLETGTSWRTLRGHGQQVHSVAFSPDGKTIASGDLGGTIKLWNSYSGCQKGTLKGHSDWVEVAFAAGGKALVSGSFDDTIKLWRLAP